MGDVVALYNGGLVDGVGHVRDRNAQKTLCHVADVGTAAGFLGNLIGQRQEALPHDTDVEWLIAVRSEDCREMRGLDLADADICIGNSERAASSVARRA